MPIPALLWSVAAGHGIWYPVNLLAAMVTHYEVQPTASVLEHTTAIGLSPRCDPRNPVASFGLAFSLVLPRLPAIPGPLAWGGLLMPLLWTAMSYGMMGVVNPVLPAAGRLAVVRGIAICIRHRGGDRHRAVGTNLYSAGRARPRSATEVVAK